MSEIPGALEREARKVEKERRVAEVLTDLARLVVEQQEAPGLLDVPPDGPRYCSGRQAWRHYEALLTLHTAVMVTLQVLAGLAEKGE